MVTLADVMLAIGRESQFKAILGQCPKFAVNRDGLDTVKIVQRDAPLKEQSHPWISNVKSVGITNTLRRGSILGRHWSTSRNLSKNCDRLAYQNCSTKQTRLIL